MWLRRRHAERRRWQCLEYYRVRSVGGGFSVDECEKQGSSGSAFTVETRPRQVHAPWKPGAMPGAARERNMRVLRVTRSSGDERVELWGAW